MFLEADRVWLINKETARTGLQILYSGRRLIGPVAFVHKKRPKFKMTEFNTTKQMANSS